MNEMSHFILVKFNAHGGCNEIYMICHVYYVTVNENVHFKFRYERNVVFHISQI